MVKRMWLASSVSASDIILCVLGIKSFLHHRQERTGNPGNQQERC